MEPRATKATAAGEGERLGVGSSVGVGVGIGVGVGVGAAVGVGDGLGAGVAGVGLPLATSASPPPPPHAVSHSATDNDTHAARRRAVDDADGAETESRSRYAIYRISAKPILHGGLLGVKRVTRGAKAVGFAWLRAPSATPQTVIPAV